MSTQANALQLLKEGIAEAKAGNKPQARKLLREATDVDPRNELAWLWLSGVADAEKDAVAALEKVLAINPANDRAIQGLKQLRLKAGITEAKAGNKAEARKLLQAVVGQEPENELAWMWLSGVAETAREAVGALEKVLTINPTNERAQQNLKAARLNAGIAEAQAGNKVEARRLLRAAAEADARSEVAWLWLATVAETPQEATAALEKVLAINPANERAIEGLKYYKAQAAPAAAWQCPYCGAGAAKAPEKCAGCAAVLTLGNLDALVSNDGAKKDKIADAAKRLEAQAKERAEFQTHYYLGLAYANLGQLEVSIRHFHAAIRQRPADPQLRNQVSALVRKREQLEIAAKEKASAAQQQAKQKTIMIVDDSPTVRKLVALTLEKAGYKVASAGDGYEAVDRIRREGTPDMVLLDITMPGMDGYQLCKLIRQHPETKHIPVVMLSGKDGFFDKMRGRMAGSSYYITKPFKPEQLVEVAEKYCPIKNGQG